MYKNDIINTTKVSETRIKISINIYFLKEIIN